MNIPIAQISLFELLQQGGWAMYPLGGLSLTLFSLILFSSQAYFGFRRSRWNRFPVTDQILETVQENPLPENMSSQERMRDEAGSVEGNTMRWIQYLNVIATIAPMVGLLGTVSGMIGAFQTIATGGMGKPELLAGDIGEALITTATGLTIGIPAMVFYFVLKNRLDTRLDELEKWIQAEATGDEESSSNQN
jgi:biopolymer transport protein ExbB